LTVQSNKTRLTRVGLWNVFGLLQDRSKTKYTVKIPLNTLWTGDVDFRLCITTVQD